MTGSISRLAAAKKRMSSSFPSWVVLPSVCWLIGPWITWHNSPNMPEHDVSAFMLSFGTSECLGGLSTSTRLCAGLSEHQRLCKREHVNMYVGECGLRRHGGNHHCQKGGLLQQLQLWHATPPCSSPYRSYLVSSQVN